MEWLLWLLLIPGCWFLWWIGFVSTKRMRIDMNKEREEKAKKVLDDAGWKVGDDGIREKDGTKLEFKILTINTPDLVKTVDLLQKQWEKIGAKVETEALSFADIQQNHIRPREYDALLVGQDINFNVDPYSFWHSSQKRDPGLNWALFDNKEADKIIENARQENNKSKCARRDLNPRPPDPESGVLPLNYGRKQTKKQTKNENPLKLN